MKNSEMFGGICIGWHDDKFEECRKCKLSNDCEKFGKEAKKLKFESTEDIRKFLEKCRLLEKNQK